MDMKAAQRRAPLAHTVAPRAIKLQALACEQAAQARDFAAYGWKESAEAMQKSSAIHYAKVRRMMGVE